MQVRNRSLWLAASLATVGCTARADEYEQALHRLTAGDTATTALVREHPEILTYLHDPMWQAVVLRAPRLPGLAWQVHDLHRPQPPIITPAGALSIPPPPDAIVLFDGGDLSAWTGSDIEQWSVSGDALISGGRKNNRLRSRAEFGPLQLHIEWATPAPPGAAWQYRGNSGVFFMGRYELQILDSWQHPTYPDGQAGALYGQWPPEVNASLPPGIWQSFDAVFEPPAFEGGRLLVPARITVLHNGIVIHHRREFLGPTAFGDVRPYEPHAGVGPIELQDHGDATSRVRFRNIWVRPLTPSVETHE